MNALKIKKKKDYYLVFSNGKKIKGKNFNLQYLDSKASYTRVGITASKKIGNAVRRNYVKRRIRSLIKLVFSQAFISVKDYVIVAKKGILSEKFDNLYKDLKILFKKIEK